MANCATGLDRLCVRVNDDLVRVNDNLECCYAVIRHTISSSKVKKIIINYYFFNLIN